MSTLNRIPGIHHITAIASSASENLAFFSRVLGMRLVKKTVNFDDPYTYHLYFGDGRGSPGTILTFFPWENMARGKPGAGMVTAVAFCVPRAAMAFWRSRLAGRGVAFQTGQRFGEPLIQFRDPDGLVLELLGSEHPPALIPWNDGRIGPEAAIRGFHSATSTINTLGPEKVLLMNTMGFSPMGEEAGRIRFKMADDAAPGHFYDLVIDPHDPPGRSGSGTVHHVAFRARDDAVQAHWRTIISDAGMQPTTVRDRKYFRSIYFNSPGGVLFEIATDPPGFGVDESMDDLGSALKLPRRYDSIREEIENRLPLLCRDGPSPFNHRLGAVAQETL